MPELLVFQQFETVEDAAKVSAVLEVAGIEVAIEEERALLDNNFIGTNYRPKVNLKMAGNDFNRAREVLLERAEADLDEVDSSYMLLSFTNEELMDVVAKPDEWGFYNYNIANALLKRRGAAVSAEQKEELENKRITELAREDRMSPFLIMTGYAIPVANLLYFILHFTEYMNKQLMWWFIPGLGGFAVGAILVYTKRTLPNGTRIPVYRIEDRKHGPILLNVNAAAFLINFILFIAYVIM